MLKNALDLEKLQLISSCQWTKENNRFFPEENCVEESLMTFIESEIDLQKKTNYYGCQFWDRNKEEVKAILTSASQDLERQIIKHDLNPYKLETYLANIQNLESEFQTKCNARAILTAVSGDNDPRTEYLNKLRLCQSRFKKITPESFDEIAQAGWKILITLIIRNTD